MKEYAVQKQLIPVDQNAGDPNWAKDRFGFTN